MREFSEILGHTRGMKHLAILICLFVFLTSFASFAEEPQVRGQIGKGTRLPLYSDKDLEEALKITDDCKAYDWTNIRYECDCVGMTFLELRRQQGEKADSYWLREKARRKCPNAPAMAGKIYSECLQWAPAQRGEDYEEFCACYGSTFAKIYSKNPTDNLVVTEAQTIKAMESCNVNAVNVRAQERDAFVRKLKEDKVYDKLFPGAKDDPATPLPRN